VDDQTLQTVTGKGGKVIPIAPVQHQPAIAKPPKGKMPPIAPSHTELARESARKKFQAALSSPGQRQWEKESLEVAMGLLADWTVKPAATIAGELVGLAMEAATGKPDWARPSKLAGKAAEAVTPNISDGANAKLAVVSLPMDKAAEFNRATGFKVTDLTGSEWAGALAESGMTVGEFTLLLKADPAKAGAMLVKAFTKTPEPHIEAFKTMATEDPAKAHDVHKEVKSKSPETAALLRSKVTPEQKAALLRTRPKDNTPAILKPKGAIPPEPPKTTEGAKSVLEGGMGYEQKNEGIRAAAAKLARPSMLGGTGKPQGGAIDFSAFKGRRDDNLGKYLARIGRTSPVLEALPKRDVFTPEMIQEKIKSTNASAPEIEVLMGIMSEHERKTGNRNITWEELGSGFHKATKDWNLIPVETDQYASYGLENIGIYPEAGSPVTTLYRLPEWMMLSSANHFGDDQLFGWTRSFKFGGERHVVEIQSDLAQHTKVMTPEEAAQLVKEIQENELEYERAKKETVPLTIWWVEQLRLRIQELKVKLNAAAIGTQVAPIIKNWPRRLIQQELAHASSKGEYTVRFASADTVAKVEGWPEPLNDVKYRLKNLYNQKKGLEQSSLEFRGVKAIIRELERVNDLIAHEESILEGLKGQPRFQPKYQGIYDRYAKDITKYLKSIGGKDVTDSLGNTWIEVPVPKEHIPRLWGTHGEQDLSAAQLRNSMQAVKKVLGGVGKKEGGAIDLSDLKKAFTFNFASPTLSAATKDLTASIQHFKETFAPASISEHGPLAEALIAQKIVQRLAKGEARYTHGKTRAAYWDTQRDSAVNFIVKYGRGEKMIAPAWQEARAFYEQAFREQYERDIANGVEYKPEENYFSRVFADGPSVEDFFQSKYGKKWGDPNFTKGRDFEFLEDALKAGYKLKTENPEMLYQMRAAASDIAESRISALKALAEQGLTRKLTNGKGVPKTKNYHLGGDPVRAPNGDLYYIDPGIRALFENAFDTNSLWNQKGAIGAVFRGTTALKNPLVMLDLGLSGFHAVHTVVGMVPGSAIARAAQLAASGSVKDGLLQAINGLTYGGETGVPIAGQVRDGIAGNRAVRIFKGEVPANQILPHELQEQQLMLEGGFSPLLDAKYKSGWRGSFATALRQKSITAVPKSLLAAMEASSSWMTEGLVPSLKADVYLKNVDNWIKANPELAGDSNARAVAFRKIAKSIENRFGQMNYDTLFWKRSVKDWSIWSSLSMGWKLGFMREFVAGPTMETPRVLMDAVRDKLPQGGLRKAIARGDLDRTIFVMGYLGVTALVYNSLSTYINTGHAPTNWLDYIYPPNGQKNPDGSIQRESNPYYTRDIARMIKMVQTQGTIKGLAEFFGNSVGPQVPAIKEFLTGVDSMGHEVSDPNADWLTKFWERGKHIAGESKPIVVQSLEKETGTTNIKDMAGKVTVTQLLRNWLGFGRAPKYIEQSQTQAKITSIYQKYYAKELQPYESVERGTDRAQLRQLYQHGQHQEFLDKLHEMKQKHHLNHRQLTELRHGVKLEGTVKMFQAFTVEQQVKLLKDMTPEEQTKYLKHAHKETKHEFHKWKREQQ